MFRRVDVLAVARRVSGRNLALIDGIENQAERLAVALAEPEDSGLDIVSRDVCIKG